VPLLYAIFASFANPLHNTAMRPFSQKRIYLDYAAATPVCDEAERAYARAARLSGNPGASHQEGREAKRVLDDARASIARELAVKPREIIFTSGSTEANNFAIVGENVPTAVVSSTDKILSTVAARFYGHPSRSLRVLGVTGTNGKTTITYMMETLLRAAGRPAGVLGTIEYRWPGHAEPAVNTTPMAADVQRLLAGMKAAGVTDVAMEVSSHSLALGRVEDVSFSVGVFTNLTQDHLDFHKDMEGYFNAKARLFDLLARPEGPAGRRAVLNGDDQPAVGEMENPQQGDPPSRAGTPAQAAPAHDCPRATP
jgi:hypothetical protein